MSEVAEQIVSEGFCRSADGRVVPLHSHTSLDQCRFIARLMDEVGAHDSLEVGLAYGISALYAAEHAARHGRTHIIIDPFQRDHVWQGLGLENLNRAGLQKSYKFIEEDARTALPKLLESGQKIGFAYVDASKRLDDILIIFWFIFQMLEQDGIVVFDDVAWFPALTEALRYIAQTPGVVVCESHHEVSESTARRFLNWIAGASPRVARRLFSSEWTKPAKSLGINAGCVALRKVRNDLGDWDWHPG